MYRDDEFYVILDKLRFDMYYATYKNRCKKYERVIVKVFMKDDEKVIVEMVDGVDRIVKDTRVDKSGDLLSFDLGFLKVMERIICDDEIVGRVYEYIDGIGAWSRVKISGYDPLDERLGLFYEKVRKVDENDEYVREFAKIVGSDVFTKSDVVKEMFGEVLV